MHLRCCRCYWMTSGRRKNGSTCGSRLALPEAWRSGGSRAAQLAFERGDVALSEPPLSPLLEGGQEVLACEFVDGIRTHVEDLRHLFAVQIPVVPVEHRARSPLRGM